MLRLLTLNSAQGRLNKTALREQDPDPDLDSDAASRALFCSHALCAEFNVRV